MRRPQNPHTLRFFLPAIANLANYLPTISFLLFLSFNYFQLMFKDALESHADECVKQECDVCKLNPDTIDTWTNKHRCVSQTLFTQFSPLHMIIVTSKRAATPAYRDARTHLASFSFFTLSPRYGYLEELFKGQSLRDILIEKGWRRNPFPGEARPSRQHQSHAVRQGQ